MKYCKQAVWAAILAVPFAAEAQGLVTQRSISTDAHGRRRRRLSRSAARAATR